MLRCLAWASGDPTVFFLQIYFHNFLTLLKGTQNKQIIYIFKVSFMQKRDTRKKNVFSVSIRNAKIKRSNEKLCRPTPIDPIHPFIRSSTCWHGRHEILSKS